MEALFYTVKEMATVLGISERSVYRGKGKIPGFVKIGGQVLFNRRTFHNATRGVLKPEEETVVSSDTHGLLN